MHSSPGSAAGPAENPPPGRWPRPRRVTVLAAVVAVGLGLTGITSAPTPTGALSTSEAPTQVNTVTAAPLTCNPSVGEPKGNRTATCTLVVTNNTPGSVELTADIAASSTSTNDQPILYYDGPPTEDPPPHVPHYQENLYVTDSLSNASLGFGALSCTSGPQTAATCNSSETGQPVASLVSGESDTFTVTIELDKGDDNAGTLVVTLTAHAGPASPSLIDTTNLS